MAPIHEVFVTTKTKSEALQLAEDSALALGCSGCVTSRLRFGRRPSCGAVPKWLRERIANPLFIGSIPIGASTS